MCRDVLDGFPSALDVDCGRVAIGGGVAVGAISRSLGRGSDPVSPARVRLRYRVAAGSGATIGTDPVFTLGANGRGFATDRDGSGNDLGGVVTVGAVVDSHGAGGRCDGGGVPDDNAAVRVLDALGAAVGFEPPQPG